MNTSNLAAGRRRCGRTLRASSTPTCPRTLERSFYVTGVCTGNMHAWQGEAPTSVPALPPVPAQVGVVSKAGAGIGGSG